MVSLIPEVDEALARRSNGWAWEEENGRGEFWAEVAQGSCVDVAETGEIRDTHSGGEVVLRWILGLDVDVCPGGLYVVDRALR